MSCVFAAGGTSSLSRTTGLPSPNAFTVCCWWKHAAYSNFDSALYLVTSSSNDRLLQWSDATHLTLFDGGAGGNLPGIPRDQIWFFGALTSASGLAKAWWSALGSRGKFQTVATAPAAGNPAGTMIIGNSAVGGGETANGRIAHVKVWDAVLTEDELRREMGSVIPKRTRNLHLWSPLRFSSKDLSGNGRNWTEGGAPTFSADEPAIPWDADLVIPWNAKSPAVQRRFFLIHP